ncbi:MAG: hypothetical protein MMC33_007089 [Icmadophila ericetorum]|nr:hypothetical protein [Icmadophila ericetorum]
MNDTLTEPYQKNELMSKERDPIVKAEYDSDEEGNRVPEREEETGETSTTSTPAEMETETNVGGGRDHMEEEKEETYDFQDTKKRATAHRRHIWYVLPTILFLPIILFLLQLLN